VPLLSPLYPKVACDDKHEVCIYTTGEAEINAAVSATALLLSDRFDFKDTYWLISGIAGINPYEGTLGSVAISRFAVQVALQQELDAREMPADWTTGYWAQNTDGPGILPDADTLYGTELFELNTNLANKVYDLVKDVELNYTAKTEYWGATFPADMPAAKNPSVIQCDTATSDVSLGSDGCATDQTQERRSPLTLATLIPAPPRFTTPARCCPSRSTTSPSSSPVARESTA